MPELQGRSPLKISRVSVIDSLAASLRERVLRGDLAPGLPLAEAELAKQYGVARPTIRAAIQQLTLTGLLVREANRSAYIPKLTAVQIKDLHAVRILIETEAIRRVIENKLPIEGAERAVAKLEWFSPDVSWGEIVAADLDFHRALVAAPGSARLLRLFQLLEDEIRLSIAQLKPAYESHDLLAEEHRELLCTIKSGEVVAATNLLRRHLEQANQDSTLV